MIYDDQNGIVDVKYIELNRIMQCCEILKKKSLNYNVESSKYIWNFKDLNFCDCCCFKGKIQQKLKERNIIIGGGEGDDEDLRNIDKTLLKDLSWTSQ